MRRLPSLAAVEAFIQVARLGSVKAAGEALALSSPALTRRVQALERFVDRTLFDRRHRQLVLTPDGERLLAELAPPLDALARAIERATGEDGLLRLRLGVQPLFAAQRLMPRLPELRARHPELHLDIDTAAHPQARLDEALDVAIGLAKEAHPGLYARRIDSNKVLAIGSRETAARLRTPADLAGETVLLHSDLRDMFEIWREAVGHPRLEPAAIDYLDSGPLILDAAARGLGIAFMLDHHLEDAGDPRLVRLFGLAAPSPYSYWFSCRRSALAKPAVKLFHDWLFEAETLAAAA